MRAYLYSAWDGRQTEFTLDAERALDALSDLLMEGLSVAEALEWMRLGGFDLAGTDMRVMGVEELAQELRGEVESLYQRYDMGSALEALRRRFEDILDREGRTQVERHGHESQQLNDFLNRRHAESASLSEAVERFRDHRFENAAAGADFQELLSDLERMSRLEDFLRERAERFRGAERADYETAQDVRERIEALERLARDLVEGNLEALTPDELRELLSEQGVRSIVLLRQLEPALRRAGFLREHADELTPRAIRRLGASALADVYAALRKDRSGGHETPSHGVSIPRPGETRPFEFGDALDLDVVRTLLSAVERRARRSPGGEAGLPVELEVDDFEIHEFDFTTQATTVLLLDMSWSMSWAGRFPAAKRVALAMDHLVRTRFPRDHFFIVGFYTRARELRLRDLPEATWNMGDPFTNLQEGLMVAERLIAKHPSARPQIIVITDGQPTAYFVGKELRVEWPMGFGGVSPRAAQETLKQVRRLTRRGVTINTFMLDDSPELVGFVEQMTRHNKGRAFYTRPGQLGSYVMVDYLSKKRKLHR
jgi:uncharacterized protein with von Willebrand factor type A (vWA) domain